MTNELRDDAKTVAHSASERLHAEADARKGGAAEQARTVSSALGKAADELGQDTPSWLRSAFQQGAQTMQRLADTVERKDTHEITRDVQQLARQNPGTFLATCALAGFAAARVMRAGASSGSNGSSGSSGSGGYGSGNDGYDPYRSQESTGSRPATAFAGGSAAYSSASPATGGTL